MTGTIYKKGLNNRTKGILLSFHILHMTIGYCVVEMPLHMRHKENKEICGPT